MPATLKKGFYLGINKEQADSLVCSKTNPIFYEIELSLDGLNILNIDNYDDWILTIAYNRGVLSKLNLLELKNKYSSFLKGFDLVIGDIVDDRIFSSLDSYFRSRITKETLIECLKVINLGKQYVCKTKKLVKI